MAANILALLEFEEERIPVDVTEVVRFMTSIDPEYTIALQNMVCQFVGKAVDV